MNEIKSTEAITSKIHVIRNVKVMLDRDLAEMYGVETRELKQAVKRNIKRFPHDFMFILTKEELNNLKSQIVMSSWGGIRHLPMAFTEQGVAMLSSVLKSDRAIEVNIQIMRAFTLLRKMVLSNEELRLKLEALEAKYDNQFQIIFDAIKQLILIEEKPKNKIGFV
ncbi:MAG: ORF6N domain-containing protein [Desulfobacterales bacterium]|nr:ORF6N domain-containing protein [Desulfobacterales bacterium]